MKSIIKKKTATRRYMDEHCHLPNACYTCELPDCKNTMGPQEGELKLVDVGKAKQSRNSKGIKVYHTNLHTLHEYFK